MSTLPDHIENLVSQFSPSQKLFCEFRARGLTLAAAAEKAGSTAKKDNLRVQGHQWENLPGSKEYIEYPKQMQAQAALIDGVELIQKLRRVFDAAMAENAFKDANKAVELLGNMIGAFGKGTVAAGVPDQAAAASKMDLSDFKEDDEEASPEEKNKRLQNLIDIAQISAKNSNSDT